MPENAVYVGRPTMWGNPFPLVGYSREDCLRLYQEWLERKLGEDPTFLDPLKGKDLACWCPIDLPCHADILLKYANSTMVVKK